MRWTACLVLLFTAAAACSDGGGGSATVPPSPSQVAQPTLLPTLVNTGGGMTPTAGVLETVVAHLAAELGVAPATISIIMVEPRTWPDGCLGITRPGQGCTQALVPGWLAVLRAPGGLEYRYRGGAGRFEREP